MPPAQKVLRSVARWTTLIAGAVAIALVPIPTVRGESRGLKRAATLERGSEVYARNCAGCHGAGGDGKGEAAAFLYPPPRDFVAAEYKFSSRPTPGLPTDEDLRQVIREGLRGTAMTGFPAMPAGDVEAVIGYLKTLSPRWEEPQDPPLAIPPDPWADDEAGGIEAGRRVYHVEAVCLSCHPSYLNSDEIVALSAAQGYEPIPLRDRAHLAIPKETANGSLIVPPDFRRDRIKTGSDLRNLYRVISAGITTTAMPTWDGVLEPEALWGLAHYVRSLAEERPFRAEPGVYVLRPTLDLRVGEAGLKASDETAGDEAYDEEF